MILFLSVIPILLITALAISIAIYYKKKMAECLPIAVCVPLILVYISGLFGNLMPGLILTLVICLFALGYILYIFIKDTQKLKESVLHYSSIVFIICLIGIFYVNFGNMFSQGDDFVTGWGGYIKSQYLYNVFSAEAPEHMGLPEYPTGFACLACFFLKISFVYNESIALLANSFLVICFVMPLFSKIKIFRYTFTSILVSIWLTITVPLIIWILEGSGYGYLYTDNCLGVMFGYVLFLWFFNKDDYRFWSISCGITLFSICLLKTNGPLFVALGIFIMTLDYFFGQGDLKVKVPIKKSITNWLKLIYIPFGAGSISFLSWKLFKNINHIGFTHFNEDASISMLFNIISGKANPIVYQGIKNTIKFFFTRPMSNVFSYIKLSAVPTTCANMTLAILSITFISRILHKEYFQLKRAIVFCIAALSSIVIYTIFYFIGFIGAYNGSTINEIHVLTAASYERYLGSVIAGLLLLSFSFLLSFGISKKVKKYIGSITIICILIFVILFGVGNHLKLKYTLINTYPQLQEMRVKIANIKQYKSSITHPNIEKIQFICPIANNAQGFYSRIAVYEAIGTGMQISSGPEFIKSNDDNTKLSFISLEEWEKSLKEYSYVYIMEIDDNFKLKYGDVFENLQDIRAMSMYRIEKDDTRLKLVILN